MAGKSKGNGVAKETKIAGATESASAIIITHGKNGDDVIIGTAADEKISGGNGNETIQGGGGNDTIQGGNGNDLITSESGNDKISGGNGADTIDAGDGNNEIDSGNEADIVRSGRGNDSIDSGNGADTIEAGDGRNKISSGNDNDVIISGSGIDTIDSGNGNDSIQAGDGKDSIKTGNGDDTVEGGGGGDEIDGGNGKDVFVYKAVSDSAAKSGAWDVSAGDVIVRFNSGDNSFDLSELVPEAALHWSGQDAEAYGVWWEGAREATYLKADTDGDGVADLAVRLKGRVTLKESDVILGDRVTPQEDPDYFMLGGKNVPKALYDVNALWQKNIGDHQVEVTAYSDLAKGKVGEFGFEYDGNITRGIGVHGGGDEELQKGEGIQVNFDGLVNELTIGVRALFIEQLAADDVETGSWKAYRAGSEVGHGSFNAVKGAVDGQKEFQVTIDGGFDTLVFYSDEAGADYHLEYIEGRYIAGEPEVLAPEAQADTAAALEDGVVSGHGANGNVLSNDSDPQGQTLSILNAGVVVGSFGTLTLNADGSYSYAVDNANASVNTLNGSESLTESFTYTVGNTGGKTAQADLTVTIAGANDAPVVDSHGGADSVSLNIDENTSVVTNVHALDVDHGAVLSYAITGGADQELFVIDAATGALAFKTAPDADAEGDNSYEVIVTAADGEGATDTQRFVIGVNDLNEFSVTAPVDSDPAVNSVNENSLGDVPVGITAFAEDADGDSTYYSLVDDAGGRFVIDPASGEVRTTGAAIDRESDSSFNIVVRAHSGDGSHADATFTIAVNDVNEFAVSAPVDANITGNAVDENAAAGVVVGITALASDADASTNGVTYTLTDDAGGRFVIDAGSGVVTTTGAAIDYESNTSFNVVVKATSQDGSSAEATFTIGVNNANEFSVTAPVDADSASNAVDENATAGVVVGMTALASDDDGDAVTYSLVSDAGGRFAVDADTGVVTTTGAAIDRESNSSFNIVVRAHSNDGSHADATFTIAVNDVNEFAVSAPVDTNSAENHVVENAGAGVVVGVTALASDADATVNGVTYALTDDAGGRFAIDAASGVVTTTGAAIDYESNTSFNLVVKATSQDGSSAEASFNIAVDNVMENPVTAPLDNDAAVNAVDENAAAGNVVGITALANDADGETVTYSLTDDAGGRFAIDAATGVVTTTGAPIDRESDNSLGIVVRATSVDGTTADTAFTIGINDVNEHTVTAPVDANSSANHVSENVGGNVMVGIRAEASDADTTNNGVTYALVDDANGRFVIDADSGVVRTTGVAIDFEATPSLDIVVRALSQDGSFADSTFTIAVDDVAENPVTRPVDVDAALNGVDENAGAGVLVGITAQSEDADGDAITYSLTDDAGGRFVIDAVTGVVTTTGAAINREAHESFDIVVRADSADGTHLQSTFTIAVNDLDEFDVTAPVDVDNSANSITENSTAIVNVDLRARATDGDATNSSVTYSLTDDAGGLFAIDADTGVVSTTGIAVDYETTASFDITVRALSADGSFADSIFTIAVEDVIEHPVTAPVDTDATVNAVDENAAAGTVVGIIALAEDVDGDAITYSLASTGGGRFTIDAATGVVTTTGSSLDFESKNSYSISVRATSADGSTAESSFDIAINDLNDVAPDFTSATTVHFDENTDVSVVAYDAEVSDPDGNAPVFSLSGNDAALFSIDAVTGEIRFLASPDFETPLDANADNRYSLTVHAFDGVQEGSKNISIVVDDVFEVIPNVIAPEFNSPDNSSVLENTLASSVIYDAEVTDPDGDVAIFSLSGADAALFSIDDETGEIRFLASPDYETPLDADHDNSYEVVVHAYDGVHESTLSLAIDVTDVFEPAAPDPNDFDDLGGQYPESGSGTIRGTTNADTLRGSADADDISALADNDLVYANAGNDNVDGSFGFDLLYGQAGDDTIDGGNNIDTIYGGSGNDSILGGSGNDVLYGGSGQDTISGTSGSDTIVGGYGADTLLDNTSGGERFVYLDILDSGDTIVDWKGSNIINLSAIDANTGVAGNDGFTFVATQNAAVIANSVTWHQQNGNTYIHADVNGDTTADLTITLTGVNVSGLVNLTESMFVL